MTIHKSMQACLSEIVGVLEAEVDQDACQDLGASLNEVAKALVQLRAYIENAKRLDRSKLQDILRSMQEVVSEADRLHTEVDAELSRAAGAHEDASWACEPLERYADLVDTWGVEKAAEFAAKGWL